MDLLSCAVGSGVHVRATPADLPYRYFSQDGDRTPEISAPTASANKSPNERFAILLSKSVNQKFGTARSPSPKDMMAEKSANSGGWDSKGKLPFISHLLHFAINFSEADLNKELDLSEHPSLITRASFSGHQILLQLKLIDAIKEAGNIMQFLPSEFGMDSARMGNALALGRVTFDDKMVVRMAIEDSGIPFTYVSANCFMATSWEAYVNLELSFLQERVCVCMEMATSKLSLLLSRLEKKETQC